MQGDAYSKARLVDREEMTQPGAEEPNDRRTGVRQLDGAIALRSFSRVQRHSRHQELLLGQCSDARHPFPVELLDLAELRLVGRMGTAVRSAQTERGPERDVADPERHRRLRDAEGLGDLGEGAVLGA